MLTRPFRKVHVLVVALVVLLPVLLGQASARAGSTDLWPPSINESSGCGAPAGFRPPLAPRTGAQSADLRIGGIWAEMFERDVASIQEDLVDWTMPMSDGLVVPVHRLALPAFEQVAENLAREAAAGNWYEVRARDTYSFYPRTVAGSLQLSTHTFGITVDINSTTNPYRSDATLITDMPGWFVRAWTDAGFCWGGDWLYSKDPMHFSWMGPKATPDYPEELAAVPVRTQAAPFGRVVADRQTAFGSLVGNRTFLLADGNRDAVPDVYRVSPWADGTLYEFLRSSMDYRGCSVGRFYTQARPPEGVRLLMADYDGTGRPDLWQIDQTGEWVAVTVVGQRTGYERPIAELVTGAPSDAADDYLVGDLDRDRRPDLFVVRRGETPQVAVYGGSSALAELLLATPLPVPMSGGADRWRLALGDRDLDGVLDLYAVDTENGATIHVLTGSSDFQDVQTIETGHDGLGGAHLAMADYDGDGRDDLFALQPDGRVRTFLGNRVTGGSIDGWFRPVEQACPATTGPFVDDDGTTHEAYIESIALVGITKGCNPPSNTQFCPDDSVTRGQMAAFLVRAFGLPAADRDYFVDDNGSVFESDINRLAASGITKGCQADRFCPGDPVTRGQMAAFLVRAFGYDDDGGGDRFIDDDTSIFEDDIDKLATAGVTLGCNPPVNNRFCPNDSVRRGEMASFLGRALGLPPLLPSSMEGMMEPRHSAP